MIWYAQIQEDRDSLRSSAGSDQVPPKEDAERGRTAASTEKSGRDQDSEHAAGGEEISTFDQCQL